MAHLKGEEKTHKLNIDRSEYYQVTGTIMIDTQEYAMLYYGGNEESDIDNDNNGDDYTHVSPDDTTVRVVIPDPVVSPQTTSGAMNHSRRDTELGISINLGSNEFNLGSNSNTPHTPAPNGLGSGSTPSDDPMGLKKFYANHEANTQKLLTANV